MNLHFLSDGKKRAKGKYNKEKIILRGETAFTQRKKRRRTTGKKGVQAPAPYLLAGKKRGNDYQLLVRKRERGGKNEEKAACLLLRS